MTEWLDDVCLNVNVLLLVCHILIVVRPCHRRIKKLLIFLCSVRKVVKLYCSGFIPVSVLEDQSDGRERSQGIQPHFAVVSAYYYFSRDIFLNRCKGAVDLIYLDCMCSQAW